eukprot:1141468-Pelagomonas_calceolata.AAC.3
MECLLGRPENPCIPLNSLQADELQSYALSLKEHSCEHHMRLVSAPYTQSSCLLIRRIQNSSPPHHMLGIHEDTQSSCLLIRRIQNSSPPHHMLGIHKVVPVSQGEAMVMHGVNLGLGSLHIAHTSQNL